MAGKFLRRDAIIDTVKGEHRTAACRKRLGLERHPVRTTSCGCPDPNCGAFHVIQTNRFIPTADECRALLVKHNQERRQSRKWIAEQARRKRAGIAKAAA